METQQRFHKITQLFTLHKFKSSKLSKIKSPIEHPLKPQVNDDVDNFSFSGEAKPVGLFGLLDIKVDLENNSDNLSIICENQKFFNNLSLFREIYPNFPVRMLKALILRFAGNFREMVLYLVEKGWESDNLFLLAEISDSFDPHFTCPYFYGNFSCSKILSQFPAFTFFTYYKMEQNTLKYYVKFCKEDGKSLDMEITGPEINLNLYPFLNQPLCILRNLYSHTYFPLMNYI